MLEIDKPQPNTCAYPRTRCTKTFCSAQRDVLAFKKAKAYESAIPKHYSTTKFRDTHCWRQPETKIAGTSPVFRSERRGNIGFGRLSKQNCAQFDSEPSKIAKQGT